MHPCQKCGACCAIYRVSFDESETSRESFHVPAALTVPLPENQLAMKSKVPKGHRCIALQGHIGQNVGCAIYANRPSPCRNFKASFEQGRHEPRCDQARKMMGLEPLSERDWQRSPLLDFS